MLQKAYGESAKKKTSVYEWYKSFQDGRETLKMTNAPVDPADR
jgi:hypothetical protein